MEMSLVMEKEVVKMETKEAVFDGGEYGLMLSAKDFETEGEDGLAKDGQITRTRATTRRQRDGRRRRRRGNGRRDEEGRLW